MKIKVEIARTPEEHERGLMHRKSLAPGHGMLFEYSSEAPRSFWMKNTSIPLDICFLDAERRVGSVERGVPHSLKDVKGEGMYVLEVNRGEAPAVGEVVEWEKSSADSAEKEGEDTVDPSSFYWNRINPSKYHNETNNSLDHVGYLSDLYGSRKILDSKLSTAHEKATAKGIPLQDYKEFLHRQHTLHRRDIDGPASGFVRGVSVPESSTDLDLGYQLHIGGDWNAPGYAFSTWTDRGTGHNEEEILEARYGSTHKHPPTTGQQLVGHELSHAAHRYSLSDYINSVWAGAYMKSKGVPPELLAQRNEALSILRENERDNNKQIKAWDEFWSRNKNRDTETHPYDFKGDTEEGRLVRQGRDSSKRQTRALEMAAALQQDLSSYIGESGDSQHISDKGKSVLYPNLESMITRASLDENPLLTYPESIPEEFIPMISSIHQYLSVHLGSEDVTGDIYESWVEQFDKTSPEEIDNRTDIAPEVKRALIYRSYLQRTDKARADAFDAVIRELVPYLVVEEFPDPRHQRNKTAMDKEAFLEGYLSAESAEKEASSAYTALQAGREVYPEVARGVTAGGLIDTSYGLVKPFNYNPVVPLSNTYKLHELTHWLRQAKKLSDGVPTLAEEAKAGYMSGAKYNMAGQVARSPIRGLTEAVYQVARHPQYLGNSWKGKLLASRPVQGVAQGIRSLGNALGNMHAGARLYTQQARELAPTALPVLAFLGNLLKVPAAAATGYGAGTLVDRGVGPMVTPKRERLSDFWGDQIYKQHQRMDRWSKIENMKMKMLEKRLKEQYKARKWGG